VGTNTGPLLTAGNIARAPNLFICKINYVAADLPAGRL